MDERGYVMFVVLQVIYGHDELNANGLPATIWEFKYCKKCRCELSDVYVCI